MTIIKLSRVNSFVKPHVNLVLIMNMFKFQVAKLKHMKNYPNMLQNKHRLHNVQKSQKDAFNVFTTDVVMNL